MRSDIVEILTNARDLIKDPEHWVAGNLAEDNKGQSCSTTRMDACKWCADGALLKVTYLCSNRNIYDRCAYILQNTSINIYKHGYVHVNDYWGHDAIMAVFNVAIENAEKGYV